MIVMWCLEFAFSCEWNLIYHYFFSTPFFEFQKIYSTSVCMKLRFINLRVYLARLFQGAYVLRCTNFVLCTLAPCSILRQFSRNLTCLIQFLMLHLCFVLICLLTIGSTCSSQGHFVAWHLKTLGLGRLLLVGVVPVRIILQTILFVYLSLTLSSRRFPSDTLFARLYLTKW